MFQSLTSGRPSSRSVLAVFALATAAWIAGPAALASGDADKSKATKDIVDTAVAAGSFGTLAAALKAAGLVETLKGKGPFTVFAPTDAAFAKLPAGTVDNLLKPENKAQLTKILTYHVVAGSVKAADVVKLTEAKTVQGQSVKITVKGGKVSVDGANVTATDSAASNGVIHVIDSVIMPKYQPHRIDHGAAAFQSRRRQRTGPSVRQDAAPKAFSLWEFQRPCVRRRAGRPCRGARRSAAQGAPKKAAIAAALPAGVASTSSTRAAGKSAASSRDIVFSAGGSEAVIVNSVGAVTRGRRSRAG